MSLPSTRDRNAADAYRAALLEPLAGASATLINAEIMEPAFRRAYGMVEIEGRTKGLIDAAPGSGSSGRRTGYELKTVLLRDKKSRARMWPAELPEADVLMPTEVRRRIAGESVQVQVEHTRTNRLNVRQLARLSRRDPGEAGEYLMGVLRENYDQALARHQVRNAAYGVLLRDLNGALLAHAELPMTLPLRTDLYWRWQGVPDSPLDEGDNLSDEDGSDAPLYLQGTDEEGRLIVKWYLAGGQVHEFLLIDPRQVVRFRVPRYEPAP